MCLQRILNIHWRDKIANENFWKITDQELAVTHAEMRMTLLYCQTNITMDTTELQR